MLQILGSLFKAAVTVAKNPAVRKTAATATQKAIIAGSSAAAATAATIAVKKAMDPKQSRA